ncbi:MAG: DUF167 family protein [Elusimicrobia bacterium]|nr:DUF167 family protein [Elusimicrobiota bacterium]
MERLIRLKVHAGSKQTRLEQKAPAAYEVWVRAEAERGLANAAALSLLARQLGVEAKRLRLIKGATSPSKIVQILGL